MGIKKYCLENLSKLEPVFDVDGADKSWDYNDSNDVVKDKEK